MDSTCKTGMVLLVGAGPGDGQLLTLQAYQAVSNAQVIVYDRLANSSLLEIAPPEAQRIYVGKGRTGNEMIQEQINALLVEKARAGLRVVRLKGGDPFIFGRGGEEAAALRAAGVPFQVLPGITAGIASAAYAGIPLTDRRLASSVAFVTGQEEPGREESRLNWTALAGIDTVVFYMGVKNLPEIARRLMAAGRSGQTPAAIIERGTTPRERVIVATLATLEEEARRQGVQAPALIVVGEVVLLREKLAWRAQLPLHGQTVLVTRTRQQASQLAGELRNLGAEVIEAPAIVVAPPEDFGAIDAALARLEEFDLVCFTSVNGVHAFTARAMELGLDGRALHAARLAAVGSATAEALRERFLQPDVIPDVYTTEAMGEALASLGNLKGARVLLARADIAGKALAEALRRAGASVEELAIYRTACPDALPPAAEEALREGRVNWITFTSRSTVMNFVKLAGPLLSGTNAHLASIGPVTSQTLREYGLEPTVEASPHDIPALAAAIRSFCEHQAQATEGGRA